MQCISERIPSDKGTIKWAKNAKISYFRQDHNDDFAVSQTLYEWMYQWKKLEHDEQHIRGILGRLLFSQNEIKKTVDVLSGGEKCRMLFGKFMLQDSNILLLDEPTNHLDMESIESLNQSLLHYEGTLIFVSHDRTFVSSLATRIIEITPTGYIDFPGTFAEYTVHKKKNEPKI